MAGKKTKAQIEFEANTSGFTSGIKSMDQSLTTLRKELNLNSAELKENADDVDLLGKRKQLLQQESEATANKIEMMKNKLAEAERLFGSSSKEVYQLNNKIIDTQTAFQKIQNEITQTDNKLNNLESGLSETKQEMKNVDNSTDQLSDGFTTMKGAIADLIADGVQQLSGALKDLVVDSDTAYSSFQAQTGTSAKEMKKFEGAIEEIYSKNYGESINDIANAMAEVKQQTQETDPSNLQKMTENALMLRDTFDFDVAESMRAVNMLTAQFGITGDEAFNLIVQGAQNGLNKNGDLLDVINEYSVHYKDLGFTSEQFFNSLVNGAGAGTFSVDKLGDAMKEFGIRSKDNSDSTKQAFKDLGLNANQMTKAFGQGGEESQKAFSKMWTALMDLKDPIKQNEIGVALFGSMWEDLGMEAISAMSDVTAYGANVNVAIDKSKQSMEELTQVKMDNITSQMSEIGRQIQTDFLIPIGEKLLPILRDGLTWLKDNLNWLLPVITGIGIAIGTYFAVSKFMSFIGVIKNIIGLVKSGTTVMGALNTVMAMNPIALIVAAIVGLIAVFVLLWNKCDGFREFWIGLWEKIKSAFNIVVEAIKTGFQAFVDFLGTIWEGIKTGFQGMLDFLGTVADWINNNVIQPIINFFKGLWNGIKAVWDGICNVVKFAINLIASILDAAFQIITLPFMFIWQNCKEYVFAAWEWIKNAISTSVNAIKNVIVTVFNAVKNFITTIFNGIKSVVIPIWNAIKSGITTVVNGIKSVVTTVFNAVKNFITNVFNGIKNVATTVWNAIKNAISTVVNGIKNVVTSVFNAVKSFVSSVWNGIKTYIINPIQNAYNTVKTTVNNIKNSVVNTFNSVKSKVTSVFNGIFNAIKTPINKARDTVKNAIDKIKGFFNFKFKWPKLSMPKFGITPEGWKVGDLLKGSIPKLSIKWNAEGGIFKKPTIFDTQHGFQGVAEAGAEAILPIEKLENWMNNGFSRLVNNNYYASEKIERLIEVAEEILDKPTDLYFDRYKVGQAMAETNDNVSGQRVNFKGRGLII